MVALAGGELVDLAAGAKLKLLRRRMQPAAELYAEFFKNYQPNDKLVRQPYPVNDLDFSAGGAYAVYNWELFFHIPLTVAMHLSKNQCFAEAQRWFHYLFDPTDDSDGPSPERFWKVRPFQSTDVKKAEEILVNLATGADAEVRNDTLNSIAAWEEAPFRPHVIARYRQQAYMLKTVMAYLDNLIDWGDSLFRQDTGEAIDEAMQLYVLATNILGPRPLPVPKKGSVRTQNYANLKKDMQKFGVVLRDMEADLLFDLTPAPSGSGDGERLNAVRSMGKALYFCVPRNDKLLGYWDTVADRLFKIRNSLNLQGVFRQLALFEPPIDPALLARAAAAGLDVGAVVSGLNQPLPLVRFQFLVQKATELAQEVKSLGNSLLSAMEKEDGEALAILRAKHERAMLEMVEHVRYAQWQEAIKAKEGLLQTLALAVQRYTYYERQLGKKADEIEKSIPELGKFDGDGLEKMKFAMQEPTVAPREIEVDIAQDLGASGGKIISSHEQEELIHLAGAQELQQAASNISIAAKYLTLLPEFGTKAEPLGVGAAIEFGGRALSTELSMVADSINAQANRSSYEASKAARIGNYARREQEWSFQSNLAAGEITQIFKQLRAAQIREAIAEKEWDNHQKQIKNAQEVEFFLTGEKNAAWTQKIDSTEKKTTNKAFYAWMKREVKGLYSQCFQFAFDIAKKAERALQHELGNPQLSYLQFGYLAGKEGLLAGEKLYLDIKRMEMAYHDQNQREYELTKHVSLLQLNPLALIQLRATGRCTIELPEELFDMDGPGHYFRRIKTVAVSVPCVTGPYASVNCTLTLLSSRIRTTPVVGDADDDSRFSDYLGSLQSIVTSSAQNDSGMFETNFRDERYLPFENSGAIGKWQLQLPANPSKDDPAQFDYDTISDVILHIRYTAREGGSLLRSEAIGRLKAKAIGSVRLFSLRNEFPTEWARFQNDAPVDGFHALKLRLRKEHFPFWNQARLKSSEPSRIDFLARSRDSVELIVPADPENPAVPEKKDALNKNMAFGNILVGELTNIKPGDVLRRPLDKADEASFELSIYVSTVSVMDISEMWIAVHW
ncbi:MAG: insecticidal toxin protein [Ottowia sp.]|nr:insecticidal toxin protein [Ottowia sp.]MBK6748017.1 insecticidal toxin protein [Ottowia sp.]